MWTPEKLPTNYRPVNCQEWCSCSDLKWRHRQHIFNESVDVPGVVEHTGSFLLGLGVLFFFAATLLLSEKFQIKLLSFNCAWFSAGSNSLHWLPDLYPCHFIAWVERPYFWCKIDYCFQKKTTTTTLLHTWGLGEGEGGGGVLERTIDKLSTNLKSELQWENHKFARKIFWIGIIEILIWTYGQFRVQFSWLLMLKHLKERKQ